MPTVSLKGVSKRYRIYPQQRDRLKEALSFGRSNRGHDFWALRDIDLEVEAGTTLGIVGHNGAGKSTLLKIIAGVLQPTSGSVEVNGKPVLLQIGAGMNPEFTGRENAMLNGLILGVERKKMLARFDEIEAFADIGEFMDQPVKNYSSGMRARLGFAVAMNVEPDVLIVDETLSVGDAVFKQKSLQKMRELRDSGTTILFVTHSMSMVKNFCTQAILLHAGRMIAAGETTEVINRYQDLISSASKGKNRQQMNGGRPPEQAVTSEEEKAPEGPTFKEDADFERRVAHLRSGTEEVRIRGVELLDGRLRSVKAVASGSKVTVRVHLEYLEAVKDSEIIIELRDHQAGQTERHTEDQFYGPNLGYVLELYERYSEDPDSVDERTREFFKGWRPPRPDANGHAPTAAGELFSASTALEGVPLKEMEKGERVVVDFTFKVPLRKGRYSISASARAGGRDSYLDRVDIAATFRIKRPRNRKPFHGIVHLPTEIKVHAQEGERQGRSA
jgi:ABC-2 type transport system ATP-binding protein